MFRKIYSYAVIAAVCVSFCACGTGKKGSSGSRSAVTALPSASSEKASASPASESREKGTAENENTYEKITSDAQPKMVDGIEICGKSAYELYTYVPSSAGKYASVVNSIADKVKGTARVYDMVIPISVGITFPDNLRDKINSSDQGKALEKIAGMMNKNVREVSLYDVLMRHRTEYIYFRTDHHWTTLGAYYAYTKYCEAAGIQAHKLSEYRKTVSRGFTGTFATKSSSLKADNVQVYHPVNEKKLQLTYTSADGRKVKWPVIANLDKYGASNKYIGFIAGDQPFEQIKNRNIHDRSTCLVVKESFGNVFVPFVADHYQTTYVIDYRYWNGSISRFVRQKKIKNVILANNISMTRNNYLIGQLARRE